uniref:Uncharacterized protein n=1 Tax=Knipowitschia caucasica TaxID=637954 RepID=A0AAV2IXE2_KNICA
MPSCPGTMPLSVSLSLGFHRPRIKVDALHMKGSSVFMPRKLAYRRPSPTMRQKQASHLWQGRRSRACVSPAAHSLSSGGSGGEVTSKRGQGWMLMGKDG